MLENKIADVIGRQSLLRLSPDTSVAVAARQMAEHHVGAMLVCEGDVMCGIFTERDMLERVVAANLSPGSTLLQDVMTPDPAAISESETLVQTIFAMKERRTRHLLVKRGDKVVGMISVHDLLRAVVDSSLAEQQQLDALWEGFPV